ncbi:MAG: hypothetical protein VKJ05_01740 [Synechococcaceae cyanobacterium]|nr:hypothetical protein [Synechococcaceae cyanobacterium]
MAEAPRDPVGDRQPSRLVGEEALRSPAPTKMLEGVNSDLLNLGGLSLLAYALYSAVRIVLSGEAGVGPEASLARMSQLVSLYPVLLLGPLLLFIPQGSRRKKGFWKAISRWLVFLMAMMFLLFVPLSVLNQYQVVQADTNQMERFEALLKKRKQEIVGAVSTLQSPSQFRQTLRSFPEITEINIGDSQTPDQIRRGIVEGIDRGIKAEVEQLRARQSQRLLTIRINVRSVAAGSLIAGLSLFSFASWLLPWLNPAGKALANTVAGIGTAFNRIPRQVRRWNQGKGLAGLMPRRRTPRKGRGRRRR